MEPEYVLSLTPSPGGDIPLPGERGKGVRDFYTTYIFKFSHTNSIDCTTNLILGVISLPIPPIDTPYIVSYNFSNFLINNLSFAVALR